MSNVDQDEARPAALSRRSILFAGSWAGAALVSGCAAPLVAIVSAPAIRRVGIRADAADLALINRVTWGVDSSAVSDFNRSSRTDYLQAQLRPVAPLKSRLPQAAQAQIDALSIVQKPMLQLVTEMEQRRRDADAIADDETKKAAQQSYQQDMNRLARDASTRMLLRALYSPNQLQEQLTWFWFNHFNVHQYKSNLRALVGDYEDRLRMHSLGKFRDLLIASATHVAMIRYLDNEQNAVNRINENYAREVMELHTLGVEGGYSQKDVQELARVLTGLGVNFTDRTPNLRPAQQALYVREGATEFNPARHDMADKFLLGKDVKGQGWTEIIEQLTRLSRHPATAKHICTKLGVYFVGDKPPASLLGRMTSAFTATDGDIALTLQAMFDSPEFTASLSKKFKDPVHYVVSAVRLAYDGKTILNCAPMLGWINRMGEGLYNRQTPDGYPMDEASWSSSGQMSTRFEIARNIGNSSAGLFRAEGTTTDAPAFPQLSNSLYHESLAATFGQRTRAALDGAGSPQEWNVLFLSSPEFMFR